MDDKVTPISPQTDPPEPAAAKPSARLDPAALAKALTEQGGVQTAAADPAADPASADADPAPSTRGPNEPLIQALAHLTRDDARIH